MSKLKQLPFPFRFCIYMRNYPTPKKSNYSANKCSS